ncbi:carbohydrate deacetylase [Morone saxatilis]|uniref:carbohydrate deacetylase n=1 Tax=Morone saxatilis TaxID=34816 RepID=UPI0015E1E382|nr:carbohydrate deacetylase [Morone saxatilis]
MPQPRMMLVVTGDDFGYCPRRNQGIVDCFQAGGISNVSLLVNASAAKEAADLAKRHKIPIGLHANLSEGIPVCQSLQQASTLINQRGLFHGKIGFRQVLERGQLSMEQVEQELRAQVRLFRELTGHLPHHMDGHQHVHVLPEVREVFAQVLSDLRIPYTRVPVESGLRSCPWLPSNFQRFYTQVEKDAQDSIPVFTRYGIRGSQLKLQARCVQASVHTARAVHLPPLRSTHSQQRDKNTDKAQRGAVVQTPALPDEPQRTKRQAISAEPTALDPSQLTDVTLTSYCKTKESSELIHRALLDNDFMKHLEHGQILTIMDCMRPTSLTKGCCVIQEGDDGSTVYVLEGEAPQCS